MLGGGGAADAGKPAGRRPAGFPRPRKERFMFALPNWSAPQRSPPGTVLAGAVAI
jgi:hypothetical protein